MQWYFPGTSSIFKTTWSDPAAEWYRPDLEQVCELVWSMRDVFNNTVAGDNPVEFDVVICAKPNIFKKIKVLSSSYLNPLHHKHPTPILDK